MKRVGFLGCGHFVKAHLEVLARCPNATVVAVAARDEAKAKALIPRATFYSDWRQLVSTTDLDVLIVCLPLQMHWDVLSHCLPHPKLAGKVILSEKPIAQTIEQAKQLIALFEEIPKERRPVWLVAENYRLEPAFARAAERAAELGRVKSFHSNACHLVSTTVGVFLTEWRKELGSYVLDSAVHYIAALRLCLGDMPLQVTSSTGSKIWPLMPGKTDTVTAAISGNECVGQFFCSFGQYATNDMRLLLCCERGNVQVEKRPGSYAVKCTGGEEEVFPWCGMEREMHLALAAAKGEATEASINQMGPAEALQDLVLVCAMLEE
jgi:predicted dehydrogenase